MITSPTMRRDRTALIAVILLSLGLNFTASWWGLPARYAWAPDELQPPVILQGIEERFSGDWHQPAYPPFHYYVLAATYLPVLFLGSVDPDDTAGRTLLYGLGRAISLVMGVLSLIVLHRIGTLLYDSATGVLAALVAALSPTFVYYAKFANLDVPAAFWVLVSLLFFLRHLAEAAPRALVGFGVTAALAMGTKDQAYAFYVIPGVLYLARRLKSGQALFDRTLLAAGGAAAFTFLLLHNVVFNFQGFVHHFEEILWARSHYQSFEGNVSQQIDLFFQTLRHLRFGLGWPLAIAAALGVGLAFSERRERPLVLWLLTFALSYYLFFVAPVKSTWLRYSVPLTMLLSVLAGRVVVLFWRNGRQWSRAGVVAALAYSLAGAVSVDLLLLQDSRYEAERFLSERVGADETIGFVGPEYYLPRLDGLPSRRIRPTLTVLERARPDYLVVNPDFASRYASGTREGEFFEALGAGRAGYALVLRHQSPTPWVWLDFEGVLGNMAKINPVIEVYQRAE